jgi:MFS family permease
MPLRRDLRAELRAVITVGAGVVVALNFGKLPPALSELREEFGFTLVEVSWLTSLLMFAGASFGIAGGSIADRFGHRRTMVIGLILVGVAGVIGAVADRAAWMFVSRMVESVGMLLTVLPAPAMLSRCVPPERLRGWLGGWSAYMPLGMSVMLILTPWLITLAGWRGAWVATSACALLWALLILRAHPAAERVASHALPSERSLVRLMALTLAAPGPWLLAVCFLFYAGQFLGTFSFLPTLYRESGIDPRAGGALTALAVLGNALGNIASGHLLQRGVQRSTLLITAATVIALMSWVIFGSSAPFGLRYAAAMTLSAVSGLVPGVLFATVPAYAPDPRAVSTTVGWMQQGSGIGQALSLPVIAFIAQWHGDWSLTWVAISGCAAMVAIAGTAMRRFDAHRRAQRPAERA